MVWEIFMTIREMEEKKLLVYFFETDVRPAIL